jgi:hypothetical protein
MAEIINASEGLELKFQGNNKLLEL